MRFRQAIEQAKLAAIAQHADRIRLGCSAVLAPGRFNHPVRVAHRGTVADRSGGPETCRKKLRTYADLGIDRLMCLRQIGGIADDKVTRSIQLIGELIPEFDQDWSQ